jgi:hypothetical protein
MGVLLCEVEEMKLITALPYPALSYPTSLTNPPSRLLPINCRRTWLQTCKESISHVMRYDKCQKMRKGIKDMLKQRKRERKRHGGQEERRSEENKGGYEKERKRMNS